MSASRSRFDLLLVEDNPADARLLTEALSESASRVHCHYVRDGIEALAFLRRQGAYKDAPRPGLVVLDINLPRMNGHELLAELAADPALCTIPTLVMTNSGAEEDIRAVYRAGGNGFVTKPCSFTAMTELARSIEAFWLGFNRVPAEGSRP